MLRALILACLLLAASSSFAQDCGLCHDVHGIDYGGIHAGGVGAGNICHTMHNSEDGVPVDSANPSGNEWLLRASAPSDVCLSCHSGYVGSVFGDDPLYPPREVGGGNFVFLLEDNLNDGHGGATNPIDGRAAGHNVVAPSKGAGPDGTLPVSPGGSYPSAYLGCTSCHDPHGNGGFRMLNGVGPVQNGLFMFLTPAPEAVGLSIYHGLESPSRHTAYRAGMSAWCGNCHGQYHQNTTDLLHPSGVNLGTVLANAYNVYNGSSDITGGLPASAYLPEVAFEDANADVHSQQGPVETSKVMCLTCHRAHASSSPDAGRWDFNVSRLGEDGVESGSYPLPNPYNDVNQRSLCNKCHVKDEFDAVP